MEKVTSLDEKRKSMSERLDDMERTLSEVASAMVDMQMRIYLIMAIMGGSHVSRGPDEPDKAS